MNSYERALLDEFYPCDLCDCTGIVKFVCEACDFWAESAICDCRRDAKQEPKEA